MTKDKRTKAQLLEDLAAKEAEIMTAVEVIGEKDDQFKRALAEQEKETTRRIWEKDKVIAGMDRQQLLLQGTIKERDEEIGKLQEMLRLESIVAIKSASFLEGVAEGVMSALKVVLGKDSEEGEWTSPELDKLAKMVEGLKTGNDLFGS